MEKNKSIVEYETVKAKNPVTGALMDVKIEKAKEITPEEQAARVSSELMKLGLEPVEQVKVEDPITGEKRIIVLDRTGHTEANLIQVLADPETPRDKKDFAISMYLYERGKQNTSMIVDLMRYKGIHTKETRVFKSQIRFDFEQFVGHFTRYLENQARLLGISLGVDIEEEAEKFAEWLSLENNQGEGYTYIDFYLSKSENGNDRTQGALIEMAINAREEGIFLAGVVKRMAEARERDKGKGIYIDKHGRPFQEDDPKLDEAIKADREATEAAKKDE